MDADPNIDKAFKFARDVDKALCTYQRMYEDLKYEKKVQSMLIKYLKRE